VTCLMQHFWKMISLVYSLLDGDAGSSDTEPRKEWGLSVVYCGMRRAQVGFLEIR